MHSRKKQQNKPREDKQRSAVDAPFLIIVLILVVFGLIMLFSASYATALYRFGDSFHFIKDQVLFAVVGVTAMFIASRVDYHIFHRLAWPLMVVSLLLLVVVLFMPALNNAHRWIQIPGLGTLQPSEIAKFAVIVLFAHIISINYAKMKTFSYGVIPFMVVLVPIIVLMILEPHLSGTILIVAIGGIMMFVGGTGLKWFGLGGGLVAGGITAAVLAFPDLVPYAMTRIEMWKNPYLDIQGKGHQTVQSLLAIGSGGVTGKGMFSEGALSQLNWVPEKHTDFIFSAIGEAFGLIGGLTVILLYGLLIWRIIYIGMNAQNQYGTLICAGVASMFMFHIFENIGMTMGIMPVTGIPLPFISYGGSSMLTNMLAVGLVMGVKARTRKIY